MFVTASTAAAVTERGQSIVGEIGIGPSAAEVSGPLVGMRLGVSASPDGRSSASARRSRPGLAETAGQIHMLDPTDPGTGMSLLGASRQGISASTTPQGRIGAQSSSRLDDFCREGIVIGGRREAVRAAEVARRSESKSDGPVRGRYG